MRRRTALIVAYAFPPNAAVGSLRPLRWSRWLPRLTRWDCLVATVDREPARRDDGLLGRVPPGLPVLRTRIREPWYSLCPPGPHGLVRKAALRVLAPLLEPLVTPDPQRFWHRTLVPAARRFAAQHHADVIIATAPPWSSLIAASRLAKVAGLPLVVDFRDPWTEIRRGKMSARRRAWEIEAERRVCAQASLIISTSEVYSRNLARRCPGVPEERFQTLHNGFDEEAFTDLGNLSVAPGGEGLTLVHLGSLYSRRRPDAMFEGIARWCASRPEESSKLRLVFIGGVDEYMSTLLARLDLWDRCEVTPHLVHKEAIRRCREADVLLLAMGDTHLTPRGWLPSKLFEYLACGRPVLANTVEGEASALLRAAGADLAIAGPAPDAFASALERYWCRKQDEGGVAHENHAAVIESLMQKQLTRRLGELLDRALEVDS